MIKAAFFDIDGTLVSFKTHRIPVSTIQALARFTAKGHKGIRSQWTPQTFYE